MTRLALLLLVPVLMAFASCGAQERVDELSRVTANDDVANELSDHQRELIAEYIALRRASSKELKIARSELERFIAWLEKQEKTQ